ncbi:MAG TPA: HAD family phosphatase [Dermatophilaceae bacterium]|nr:HAD family phosphatase [Dermatophilaceae bacterium]
MPPEVGSPERPSASRTPGRLPAAVLWDLDGTLIDSEPYWVAEEFALVEESGGVWSMEHATTLVGGDLMFAADYLRRHGGVRLPTEDIVHRLLAGVAARVGEVLPWRPGARELLAELRTLGVPCALVTMSWSSLAEAVVRLVPAGSFAAVVTGDQVAEGKPHPEAYLRAATLLGVDAAACVALEDSANGALSAHAAGARTIVVPHTAPVPPHPELTRLDTLAGVTATDLHRLTEPADAVDGPPNA